MMYITWFVGVLLACLISIMTAVWYEQREDKKQQ